jgi:OOP family OmpA-OmpF porin
MNDSKVYDSTKAARRYWRISIGVAILLAVLLLLLGWMGAFSCTSCENTPIAGAADSASVAPAPVLAASAGTVPVQPASVAIAVAAPLSSSAPESTCGPISEVVITFASWSSELEPDAQAKLTDIAKCIKGPTVVAGHSDATGTRALNIRVSAARAKSVKKFLVTTGAQASLITTKAYGESKPVADNATREGRAQNRRVSLAER